MNNQLFNAGFVRTCFKAVALAAGLLAALFVAVPSLVDRWFAVPGDSAVAPVLAAIFVFLVAAHILADIFARDQIGFDQWRQRQDRRRRHETAQLASARRDRGVPPGHPVDRQLLR